MDDIEQRVLPAGRCRWQGRNFIEFAARRSGAEDVRSRSRVHGERPAVLYQLRVARNGVLLGAMKLHVLPAGVIQTNAYLLTSAEKGEAILIDAPGDVWAEVGAILREEKCRLTDLWLTHGHWDHTQGGAEVIRETKARVAAHPADRLLIETPEIMKKFMGEDLNLEPIHVDHWLKEGEHLTALGVDFEVRHVPGHCPGNVLFYAASAAAAFVGDALFAGSVGRSDLPGGDFKVLENSIRQQIYTLPGNTRVFPGHGPATSVDAELTSNPYVSG